MLFQKLLCELDNIGLLLRVVVLHVLVGERGEHLLVRQVVRGCRNLKILTEEFDRGCKTVMAPQKLVLAVNGFSNMPAVPKLIAVGRYEKL